MKHRRIIAILTALMMLLSLSTAMAEEEGLAVPVMGMSMEDSGATLEIDEAMVGVQSEPFIPEGEVEKLIIGSDDRVVINNMCYPYSAIAYMEVEARCGCTWTASGFLVAADVLMTGAHCVVCTDHGETANKFTMYFGYKSRKDYKYRYTNATTYWYGTGFRNSDGSYSYTSQHRDWDYAYIKLSERVGDTVGWFGTAILDDGELQYSTYELAGYRDGVLKSSWGYAMVKNDWTISYTNDMLPGNSGCPVFTSDYYVVAINVAHNDTLVENYGRRITSDLVNEMYANGMFN